MCQKKEEEKLIYPNCLRCGRKLKTDEAIQRGMGKICLEKSKRDTYIRRLFDAKSNTRIQESE